MHVLPLISRWLCIACEILPGFVYHCSSQVVLQQKATIQGLCVEWGYGNGAFMAYNGWGIYGLMGGIYDLMGGAFMAYNGWGIYGL